MFVPYNRRSRVPINPLLFVEEDKFFYYASILFDEAGSNIGPALRALTNAHMQLGELARNLLINHYLDPIHVFDDAGHKRPLLWGENKY
jgi:hypothetical protein